MANYGLGTYSNSFGNMFGTSGNSTKNWARGPVVFPKFKKYKKIPNCVWETIFHISTFWKTKISKVVENVWHEKIKINVFNKK